MAPVSPDFRWAAKIRRSAAFCLIGAVAGTGLYFGNLAYVSAHGPAAVGQRRSVPAAFLARLPVGSGVNGVAFSPDGKLLATGDSDGTARLWDVATRTQIGSLSAVRGGSGFVSVATSPDGMYLASAIGNGNLQLWSSAADKPVWVPTTGGSVNGVAFSPDGKILATAESGGARLWAFKLLPMP